VAILVFLDPELWRWQQPIRDLSFNL